MALVFSPYNGTFVFDPAMHPPVPSMTVVDGINFVGQLASSADSFFMSVSGYWDWTSARFALRVGLADIRVNDWLTIQHIDAAVSAVGSTGTMAVSAVANVSLPGFSAVIATVSGSLASGLAFNLTGQATGTWALCCGVMASNATVVVSRTAAMTTVKASGAFTYKGIDLVVSFSAPFAAGASGPPTIAIAAYPPSGTIDLSKLPGAPAVLARVAVSQAYFVFSPYTGPYASTRRSRRPWRC